MSRSTFSLRVLVVSRDHTATTCSAELTLAFTAALFFEKNSIGSFEMGITEVLRCKYQPLTEADSIRLLLIQPASSPTAEIKCSLLHTTLFQCDHEIIDHYTALSYVWGTSPMNRIIHVDGYPVNVTPTLEAAIRDLRDETRPLRIWADALCIDQSNILEVNQQVRQMGRIYSTAHHTVIHLGSLTPAAAKVLEAVPSKTCGIYSNLEANSLAHIIELATSEIITLPWFSRVWIFQEMVLSRDLWIQCGTLRARWTDFCDLLLTTSVTHGGSVGALNLLRGMNNTRAGRSGGTLLNLLLSRRGLGATNPKDMIFAHMGIAADRQAWGDLIKVDYRKSCPEVYEDAGRYLIDTVGPEKMFAYLDSVDPTLRQPDLASWTPDWHIPGSYLGAMYRDNKLSVKILYAKRYYAFIEQLHVLAFMGYEVDVISDVSITIPPFPQMRASSRVEYQQTVQDIKDLYRSVGGTYWSGDERGQHVNIPLRGKEEEHKRLCNRVCHEWVQIMENELPLSLPPSAIEKLKSHQGFLNRFKVWLAAKAEERKLFVGAECDGIISCMDHHLTPTIDESVLDNRKLATTQSGRVAIVPSQARGGDAIAYLAGSAVSVVVRRSFDVKNENLQKQIREAFKDNYEADYYVSSFAELFQTKHVPVDHCSLVGECYVDGLVGWAVNQEHDHRIFAFH